MLKLAFYGKSGVGKSTAGKIAKRYFEAKDMTFETIKLASPLYEIQQHFYQAAGKEVDFYQQDQGLLEMIAANLRKINYQCLTDQFDKKLKSCNADIVMNDDVRDTENDFPYLKDQGFLFIKLECDESIRQARLKKRNDLTTVIHSKTTDSIDTVKPDFVFNTSDTSENQLEELLTAYLDTLCHSTSGGTA